MQKAKPRHVIKPRHHDFMTAKTHHACALEINQTGILIKGKSGSGKTSLMMGLLERARIENLNAFMVADDQVILNCTQEKLTAIAPEPIAGLVELRGYGIIKEDYKDCCDIKLFIEIIDDDKVDRLPEEKYHSFKTITLPLLEVPKRHESQAVRIIFAWLKENANLQVE